MKVSTWPRKQSIKWRSNPQNREHFCQLYLEYWIIIQNTQIINKNKSRKNESFFFKKWVRYLNRELSPEKIKMSKNDFTIFSHWGNTIKIKTTLRFHFTPIRKTKINKITDNKFWWDCRERWTLILCWWECKLVQSLSKSIWRILRKLKINRPLDSALLLFDRCLRTSHPTPQLLHQLCLLLLSLQKLGNGNNLHAF